MWSICEQTSPYIGWHKRIRSGKFEHVLKGNWTKTPPKAPLQPRTLLIGSWDCSIATLNCLSLFSRIESLRLHSCELKNVSGLSHLKRLRELEIDLVPTKHLRIDFSEFKNLESLSSVWSHHFRNLNTCHRLKTLHLHHICKVERLDLSPHPRLKRLDIGPAKAIKEVSLDGLNQLATLGLVLMPRLSIVSGESFYHTVRELDIRGSHSLPKSFLGSFTNLRTVDVGLNSKLGAEDFRKCRPELIRSPV